MNRGIRSGPQRGPRAGRWPTVLLALAGLSGLLAQEPSGSQPGQAVAPAPAAPQKLTAVEHVAPFAVGLEDPEALRLQLERLRLAQRGAVPPPPRESATDREVEAAERRVIELDVPRFENPAAEFRFRDATPRDAGTAGLPRLSLEQRRAAVEAYRRSLAQDGGR